MEIPKELSSPINKALYRLSMGDMTVREMQEYLTDPKRKNTAFPEEIATKAVDFLRQEGFLDDKRYLRLAVAKLDRSLAGKRKIRQVLSRHLFPPAYIEAALNRPIDYAARALALLEKKSGAGETAKTPAGRKKLTDYLIRQGYDYGTAREALSNFSEEDDPFLD